MSSPDIGEQAISKAAEVGLESQLDKSEDLNVDVRTNPLDLMQGDVDSVSVKGEGLVMQKELRAEKMQIETNSISIDPIKAALGDIKMEQPTDARMMVVLKEEDIQRAFNSDYVKDKLKNIELDYGGETATAQIQEVNFSLPEMGKVKLDADLKLVEQEQDAHISFTAVPEANSDGNSISLKSVEYLEEAEYNQKVAEAIINSTEEILDLRNFELDEMSLRVRKLDVQTGKLTIEADAQIKEFPDGT